MKCGALIIAAGASTRLGFPKQVVRLGNETLLDRSIRIATEAGCSPIVVVVGAFEDTIRGQCKLHGIALISNPDWEDGMGTSLSKGVRMFGDIPGILVMTCDMPAVTPDHLRALARTRVLTASSYAGRSGVPAYFPNNLFPELAKIRGDMGARSLLKGANQVELRGGELDVDTTEDLVKARELFS
jgi:CTP:molybdopterin cytidylyltransferase MocA